MIQIYKDDILISVQANKENAEFFCKQNRIVDAELVEVKE